MKVRIKFSKQGPVKFVGHLDTMRYFQKAIRRAGLPAAFSGGYSPHMIMSFAAPLGVGTTSQGEYFDVEFTETIPTKEIVKRLNSTMAEGMEVLSARQVEDGKASKAMSLVAAADYYVEFREGKEPKSDWKDKISQFLSQEEILVTKKTKKSEKEVNIRPWILELEQRENGLFLKVRAGSSVNLKPELVVSALLHKSRVDKDAEQDFRYHRLENYAVKDEQLVALDALGTEIL